MNMKKFTCSRCGEKYPDEEARSVEVKRGVYEDFCDHCEAEETTTCTISSENLDPAQESKFILIKTEAANTMDRPPGIYRVVERPFYTGCIVGSGWMHADSLLFVAPLPKPDVTYDLSGKISRASVQRLGIHKVWRKAYGKAACKAAGKRAYKALQKEFPGENLKEKFWDLKHNRDEFDLRASEKEHARATILANPDILRDLECDAESRDGNGNHISYADDSSWKAIQAWLGLPDGLPTYHELVILSHKGVKVYGSYHGSKANNWIHLQPEPRFRGGRSAGSFTAYDLPFHKPIHARIEALMAIKERNWSWKWSKASPETLLKEKENPALRSQRLNSLQREIQELKQPTGERVFHIYKNTTDEKAALETLKLAIDCGALNQNGYAKPHSRVWKTHLSRLRARAKKAVQRDNEHRLRQLADHQTRYERLLAQTRRPNETKSHQTTP